MVPRRRLNAIEGLKLRRSKQKRSGCLPGYCVAIVFPDFLLYLRIEQVCFCTQKGIQATHFSSLNEQISLKLLVGVTPKIEANLKHLTDYINFFLFHLIWWNQSPRSCSEKWLRSVEIKISMKFNITTSYQKMFLYFYPALYSQRESGLP